jgi:hypothetical protein
MLVGRWYSFVSVVIFFSIVIDVEMAVQPFFGFVYSLVVLLLLVAVHVFCLVGPLRWYVIQFRIGYSVCFCLITCCYSLAISASVIFPSNYFWDAVAKPRGDQCCLICLMDDTVSYRSFGILLLIVIFRWLQCMFFVLSDPCWYSFVLFIPFMFSFFFHVAFSNVGV